MGDVVSSIQRVKGFRAAGIHAGLKKDDALDLALIIADRNCAAAGVFTKNLFKAAPVLVNMEHLQAASNRMRGVVINTVSANAGTGRVGLEDSRTMARLVAQQMGCDPSQIFVMSTGVIGTHLPMEKIDRGIARAYEQLGHQWEDAARAIMTTDTRPKLASKRVYTSNGDYMVAGIVKGAGMIAPNMATMLSILVTDAILLPEQAQQVLSAVAATSYNRIVVDGDTSTNDMVVLLASGASGVPLTRDTDLRQFQMNLQRVAVHLAKDVIRDGEGVTKFITVDVLAAESDEAAAQIAHTIASSPLVKTAFFGNDANWGRIIAAAGRAGVPFEPDLASLWMSPGEELFEDDRGLLLFQQGVKANYPEDEARTIIGEAEIYVTLDLGMGAGRAVVWTCDLSHDYVSINAEYRT